MPDLEDFTTVDFKSGTTEYHAKIWVGEQDNDLYYQVAFHPSGNEDDEKMIFVKQDDKSNWVQMGDGERMDEGFINAIGVEIDDYE